MPGSVVEGSCQATGEKVWTVASVAAFGPGLGGPGGVNVFLVNGVSGAIEETILVEEFSWVPTVAPSTARATCSSARWGW